MKNFPFKTHPTGWFQLGWARDLLPGDLKKMTIFDQDVVLYRTQSGVLRLVDAYCPHLGAHLGNGKLDGELLRCPFHGWAFNTEGYNVDIPFCDKPNSKVRLKDWVVKEQDGIIICWYDAKGREPFWVWSGAPEFSDEDNYYPMLSHYSGIRRILPHQPLENTPDLLHFPFVHGNSEPVELTIWDEEFPVLHYGVNMRFGDVREKTWLTPDGPIIGKVEGEGTIGLGYVRLHVGPVSLGQLVAVTPVTRDESMVFSTTAAKRDPAVPGNEPQGIAKIFMETQHPQIENDFAIWEEQAFVEHPPFAGVEQKHYARFRRFLKGYWPESEKEVSPAYAVKS